MVILVIGFFGSANWYVASFGGMIYMVICGTLLIMAFPTMPISAGAQVQVSLNSNTPDALRFDVTLDKMLVNNEVGQEVTINFISPDIKNGDTFYTDSNSLQM